MALPNLPRAQAPLTLGGDRPTNEWRRFFERLAGEDSVDAVQSEIQEFAARLKALEDADYLSGDTSIRGPLSVRVVGVLSNEMVTLQLVGDQQNPAETMYYGTGPDAEKGWYTIASAFLADPRLEMTVGTDGVITFDLAELADTGVGAALVKTTRDAYGRTEGTEAATTDDLDEGSNLYFTDQRAIDATLAHWAASPDAVDDAAAATAGVPVGGAYRTGSIAKIRIT